MSQIVGGQRAQQARARRGRFVRRAGPPPELAVLDFVMADGPDRGRVDVNRHRPRFMLHTMDAVSGKREAVSSPVLAHAPRRPQDQRLVSGDTLDDVDADTGAIVVVVAGVSLPPPEVQPGLGAVTAPQQNRVSGGGAIERRRVKGRGSPSGVLHAFLGCQRTGRRRQPVELGAVDDRIDRSPSG